MKQLSIGLIALVLLGAGCMGGGGSDSPTSAQDAGQPAAGGVLPAVQQDSGLIGAQTNDLRNLSVENGQLLYELLQAGGEMKDEWNDLVQESSDLAAEQKYGQAEDVLRQLNAEMQAELNRLQ